MGRRFMPKILDTACTDVPLAVASDRASMGRYVKMCYTLLYDL